MGLSHDDCMRTTVTTPNQREADLIARIKAGERDLFYELIQPYQRTVYAAAFSVLGNASDAEDAAQEAFLKALTHLGQFRAEAKFSTWLVQITLNEARLRIRKDRKGLYSSIDEGRQDDDGEYFPIDYADWREIPSETLQRKELKEALQRALASLKPIYREVLVLRDIEHLSITEAAAALDITEASVKTRLLRARLMMRDALAPGFDGSWSVGSPTYKKVRPF
jgi:RNA polymerase sigma-70 factor (ECF subfamily)